MQPGPFSSTILFKNSAQMSNSNLVAGEQFQIGGPGSVRGYPPAELAGDKGLYSSVEWSFPPYFFPRNIKVPFTDHSVYDSFRIVTFYDWAETHANNVTIGEKKHKILRSCGFGFRFNLGRNFSARIELGYPLSNANPSNGKNVQKWFEITGKF